ncbi:MAG: flagellar hook protein FlgE [Actinomycetota bacterium]
MFAGVSGLRSHQIMMDVVGNNIANVNTVGFKSSRVTFADALSQLVRGSSGGTGEATVGMNPHQVGLGVRVASTDLVFTQGGSQLTGKSTDVSIQGEGFFVVRFGSEQLYTRAGAFSFDQNGNLTDPSGAAVQGWLAALDGTISSNAPVQDIKIPVGQTIEPTATTAVRIGGNVSAGAETTDDAVITAIDIVDNVGDTHRMTFELVKTGDNAWEMTVQDPDGNDIGTTALTFDPDNGQLSAPTTPPSFTFTPPGGSAVDFTVDFGTPGAAGSLTQFGGSSDAAALGQDGSTSGYLRAFAIGDDGVLSGVFSNGRSRPLARLAVANFNNPSGLVKAGDSRFRSTTTSGAALVGESGSAGRGGISAGTLEMSNVELAQEFTNLIIAQRGFQANSRIITSSDEMLQDLVNLKR